ncbi:uncharacterized protein LOC124274787 [Haliotis rubra]|uniref:uncharacterized protein LOC124274787 n=1 Tax=Haliotis rubra TaxID=36100 RepID=UPI001EE5CFD4|nr:uncharacterized protein LOC124274787 [Haliotis rubra]
MDCVSEQLKHRQDTSHQAVSTSGLPRPKQWHEDICWWTAVLPVVKEYPSAAVADVKCQQALAGNNLTIQTNSFLTLCEVQIFVCSDGWFGEDCDKQCHCSLNTEVCDKITDSV